MHVAFGDNLKNIPICDMCELCCVHVAFGGNLKLNIPIWDMCECVVCMWHLEII